MAPMIAGLGITGNVLGLALKDSIANFFAGFMIILNEPFRKNDYVELGAYAGTIKAMDLMCVRMRTPDGRNVTISNNLVWATPVTNYSDTDKRRLSLIVGVPYDTNLKAAKKVFVNLINSYPEVLSEPAPLVEILELADSSINFVIRPWVKPADFWTITYRFNAEITGKLAEKDIYLPFLQLDVNLQK
jgi:small conductance mechanosensitive channel